MDPELVRLYGLIFAPSAIALVDTLRFRSGTWRRAGERRWLWRAFVVVLPWLGPGFYASGPRLRLRQEVETMREEAQGLARVPRRELRIVVAEDDLLADWRAVHNAIVPTDPLSLDEVAERARRHRLTLAYVDDELVGNATVRPPLWDDEVEAAGLSADAEGVATVIVRILPEHRRRGLGSAYYDVELAVARGWAPRRIETVVLESNADGLAFAAAHGFVEHDRHTPDGHDAALVGLHLPDAAPQG